MAPNFTGITLCVLDNLTIDWLSRV